MSRSPGPLRLALDPTRVLRHPRARRTEWRPMLADTVHLRGGELNAALASAVVGIYRMHLGRGPSSACTFHNDDVVTVVMREVMSSAEKTLAVSGSAREVTHMRRLFQQTMEADFRAAVERL